MEFTVQILISIIMALLISLATFMGKVQKGEKFDFAKLLRTALIGLALGAVAAFSGAQITMENWEMYMAANAGAVAVADQGVKAALRLIGGAPAA